MKIIGGYLKGRNFFMPAGVRPTKDLTRKAIFDLLGQDMTGMDMLELFAGSGSVGLEAISRGARKVVFVEKDMKISRVIEQSIQHLKIEPGEEGEFPYEVYNTDSFIALKQLSRMKRKFDIIFLDPPYGLELAKKILKLLVAYDILHPDCFLIIEHDRHETLPEAEGRFSLIRHRKYGSSYLSIYQGNPANQVKSERGEDSPPLD